METKEQNDLGREVVFKGPTKKYNGKKIEKLYDGKIVDRPRADWQPDDDGDSFSTAAEQRKRPPFTFFV